MSVGLEEFSVLQADQLLVLLRVVKKYQITHWSVARNYYTNEIDASQGDSQMTLEDFVSRKLS